MVGRLPKADGEKARIGAQGLKAEALDATRSAGVHAPTILDRHGREEWARVLSALAPKQNLSVIDLGPLEMMCVEFQNWKRAELAIQAKEKEAPGSGLYQTSENGYRNFTPEKAEARRAQTEYRKWADRFGATPIARLRTNGTAQGDLFDWGVRGPAADPDEAPRPIDPTDPYASVSSGRIQ